MDMEYIQYDEQENEGECILKETPVFNDLDGKKFYTSVIVHNLNVYVGDNVRVKLEAHEEADEDQGGGENALDDKCFGFGQGEYTCLLVIIVNSSLNRLLFEKYSK